MRKLGIAAKLYLAFGSIFLLAVVASSTGWKGFQRVADSQHSVIDKAIPGLRQAHQLASLNALIGSAAQRLIRAEDEQERVKISSALFTQVNEMNTLLEVFQKKDFSAGSLEALRQTVLNIESKLQLQDELVRRRIHQQAHFSELAIRLIEATEELNELATSLVANAAATSTAITSNLYDLVESNADKQQLYDVFDRLIEVDLDAMERMYELRLRSANLNSLFNQVAKESEIPALNILKTQTIETISILKRRVREINDPQRRRKATELLIAMEVGNGPLYVYGIFEARVSLVQITRDLTTLSVEMNQESQALNSIINELNVAGGTLINQVSITAKDALDTSRRLFSGISIMLLLVAAAILWWFIQRNVVRRLLLLQSATRSITQGNYDVDITISGNDELTDMGKALHGFRNNAIRNRKLDEELQQYKTHLEELVEERSEQLHKTNQMLSEEVQKHAMAREKAEHASQAKTTFLATMSHELRTPLSGALGTLQLLSDTKLQQKQSDYVNIINAANTTLLDIVNDILGYSQLEAGKLHLENKRFELSELVNDVMGLMAVSVNEKHNALELKMQAPQPLWLLGDSGKLHQILINLIGNANKFTDKGSIILQVDTQINQKENKAHLQFSVIDNGIGIAKEKQEDIFQAFTQVDASSARRYGGIGLGLAICDRLINAMEGNITLNSELGRGTQISFELDVNICQALPVVPTDEIEIPSLNILMVEDDDTNSMVTDHYLKHLGHRVISASTGEEALKLLNREQDLSLILLDISLPGIDGIAILSHIRSHTNKDIAKIPVIAMSAHVFAEEVKQYLDAGMDGCLGKPFSLEDLKQAIIQAINSQLTDTQAYSQTQQSLDAKRLNTAITDEDINKLGFSSVEQLSDLFFQSIEQLNNELSKSINDNNIADLKNLAHRMNGASGNFGLEKLCLLLGDIEDQAKNNHTVNTDLIEEFNKEYDSSITALKNYLKQQKAENKSA